MTRLGIGAVEIDDGNLSLITYGMLVHPRNPALKFNAHLNEGIEQITIELPRLIDLTKPDIICGEIVPAGRLGSNSELVVAAITACKVIAFQFGIPWKDLAANTVKKQVTGDGLATKAAVRNAIIAEFPKVGERHAKLKKEQKAAGEPAKGLYEDVFDAVAIAACGAKLAYGNISMREVQAE